MAPGGCFWALATHPGLKEGQASLLFVAMTCPTKTAVADCERAVNLKDDRTRSQYQQELSVSFVLSPPTHQNLTMRETNLLVGGATTRYNIPESNGD